MILISIKMLKMIEALKTNKGREKYKSFIVEGEKQVSQIPKPFTENGIVTAYVFSEGFAQRSDIEAYKKIAPCYIAGDREYDKLSDTLAPQGVLAVCRQLEYSHSQVLNGSPALIVVAHEVTDPGNLGTIIRTADAAGASGLILTKGCIDCYNPKVVRAAAGSIFNIPFVMDVIVEDAFSSLKERGIKTIATHLKGKALIYDLNLKEDAAIVIGNEGRGLPEEVSQRCSLLVKIPMVGMAESLNASVACGVILYEAVRQRGFC